MKVVIFLLMIRWIMYGAMKVLTMEEDFVHHVGHTCMRSLLSCCFLKQFVWEQALYHCQSKDIQHTMDGGTKPTPTQIAVHKIFFYGKNFHSSINNNPSYH